MIFLETSIFTRLVTEAMDDSSYQALQAVLAENPAAGDMIRNSGGLRKIRWAASGRGKRGGSRVVYYWDFGNRILMVYLYTKNEQEDLTSAQFKAMRADVEEYKK